MTREEYHQYKVRYWDDILWVAWLGGGKPRIIHKIPLSNSFILKYRDEGHLPWFPHLLEWFLNNQSDRIR